jgi:hypothetical protein
MTYAAGTHEIPRSFSHSTQLRSLPTTIYNFRKKHSLHNFDMLDVHQTSVMPKGQFVMLWMFCMHTKTFKIT